MSSLLFRTPARGEPAWLAPSELTRPPFPTGDRRPAPSTVPPGGPVWRAGHTPPQYYNCATLGQKADSADIK
ncbi:hypothetical protein [Kamptonema formosum]|uniref:hypothetical protein n=1 Tax=Kamptonema formosum TaxID=331992 RepID=UPI000349EA24|nr:hypothetical protein [Oscillatoria sp. PCC 10802]